MSISKHIKEHEMLDIQDKSASDLAYLHLDQTTPQTIENGAPTFSQGIKITKDNYLILNE